MELSSHAVLESYSTKCSNWVVGSKFGDPSIFTGGLGQFPSGGGYGRRWYVFKENV